MAQRAVHENGEDRRAGRAAAFVPMEAVRRRYHVHWPGIVYVLTTVLLALGAINSQNNLLYWAFGIAISGLLISGIVSGAVLMGMQVERAVPAHGISGPEGQTIFVRYRLRNGNRLLPAFAVYIDELPHPIRRRRDQAPTWPGLVRSPSSAFRGFASYIPARRTVEAVSWGVGVRRGEARFSVVRVWTTFPFGIARKSVDFAARAGMTQTAVVRPRVLRLKAEVAESAGASGRHERTRESARNMRSTGEEFLSVREYAEGDPMRLIAWRPSARAQTLIVRQTATASADRRWVALLLPSLEGELSEHDERAICLAASVLKEWSDRGAAVGLAVPAYGLSAPPREGHKHLERLLDDLGRLGATANRRDGARIPPGAFRGDPVCFVAERTMSAQGAKALSEAELEGLAAEPVPAFTEEAEKAAARPSRDKSGRKGASP